MSTVKHRRGTEEEWLLHDPVIPDGEIALVSYGHEYDVKVGDGQKKYSELSPLNGKFTESMEDFTSVTLLHRDDARFAYIEELEITIDDTGHPDYCAILSFTVFDFSATLTFNYDAGILFSGTDVTDGVFVPELFMHYTLFFWKDMQYMNCHVRGVYVE